MTAGRRRRRILGDELSALKKPPDFPPSIYGVPRHLPSPDRTGGVDSDSTPGRITKVAPAAANPPVAIPIRMLLSPPSLRDLALTRPAIHIGRRSQLIKPSQAAEQPVTRVARPSTGNANAITNLIHTSPTRILIILNFYLLYIDFEQSTRTQICFRGMRVL